MLAMLRRLYAPLFFVGFLACALTLSDGGARPLPLVPLLVGAILVSALVERVIPYDPRFNEPCGDRGRDVAHALVNEIANSVSVLAMPLVVALAPGGGGWPYAWPIPAQLALAIVIADCGITLAHWASHRAEVLWRFHAVHHSVERLYGFNGLMKHPLHQAFELTAATVPLVLLGMPQNVAWLLTFAVAIQLLLQHSNADMRVGVLAHVWAVAPAHRWHHVAHATEGDVNFGLFTCLWDHLLGTFRAADPGRRFVPGDFGVADRPDYPRAYAAQMVEPFRVR
jgi:sterol desaturase/sphingolipid hydroxylase (fatty acid hydroxylase superfamily)